MDVVIAFLNGILEETIYLQQPDGYVQQGKEHLVCKLNKSLYGLKQSPRCWNKVLTEFMKSIGFTQSSADPCIYVRDTSSLTIVAAGSEATVTVSVQNERHGRTSLLLRDHDQSRPNKQDH